MQFTLTEEQDALRASVRRFLEQEYPFEARQALANSELGFSRERWQEFADLGWLGLGIPEELGGLGGTFRDLCILLEDFGAHLLLEPFCSTAVLASRILEKSPRTQQTEALLARIAQGSVRLALAHSESDSRYGEVHVATSATSHADGYSLSGGKCLVLDAPGADLLIVSARVDEDERYGLFLVDVHAPGIELNRYPLLDGTRAADVRMNNVVLERTALFTPSTAAASVLDEAIDRSILAGVAYMLGVLRATLNLTATYTQSRVQFGQPLFKLQSVQHKLADMFVEVQQVESILQCGISQLDRAAPARAYAVSAAKLVTMTAGRAVTGMGVQAHGAIGLTDEYRMGHYFKKLLVFEKLLGDIDYHAERMMRGQS